jgi:hypothetical protein
MACEQVDGPRVAQGRRRFPRLNVDGDFQVRDLTLHLVMDVEDVSYGGCRTVSPIDLPIGSQHTFQATVSGRPGLALTARVIHCHPIVGEHGPFSIGWQWAADLVTARSITRIIDMLTDAQSFAMSSLYREAPPPPRAC